MAGEVPLDNEYHYKGKKWPANQLSDERIVELADKGATLKRGLRDRRAVDRRMFRAMFQQERDLDGSGDFTEATFEAARQPDRTFGVAYPHELVVVGVDPARTYGAAWVALAVDRTEKTITVCDFFYGEQLGTTGIKQRLILEPLAKWNPIWLCYETNRESAVLDDTLIAQAIRESGVSVYRHNTGRDRSDSAYGVGSIAHYMRSAQFLIPHQTAEDRTRFETVKAHFKAWDSGTLSSGGRSRPGQGRHIPDDLAMAAWIGWLKAREIMEGSASKNYGIRMGVPPGLLAKFDPMAKTNAATRAAKADKPGTLRRPHTPITEALEAFAQESDPIEDG